MAVEKTTSPATSFAAPKRQPSRCGPPSSIKIARFRWSRGGVPSTKSCAPPRGHSRTRRSMEAPAEHMIGRMVAAPEKTGEVGLGVCVTWTAVPVCMRPGHPPLVDVESFRLETPPHTHTLLCVNTTLAMSGRGERATLLSRDEGTPRAGCNLTALTLTAANESLAALNSIVRGCATLVPPTSYERLILARAQAAAGDAPGAAASLTLCSTRSAAWAHADLVYDAPDCAERGWPPATMWGVNASSGLPAPPRACERGAGGFLSLLWHGGCRWGRGRRGAGAQRGPAVAAQLMAEAVLLALLALCNARAGAAMGTACAWRAGDPPPARVSEPL